MGSVSSTAMLTFHAPDAISLFLHPERDIYLWSLYLVNSIAAREFKEVLCNASHR